MIVAELKGTRVEVLARGKANEAEAPGGSVPRPLRSDAKPAWSGDPLKLADNWIPCGASFRLSLRTCHFPSSLLHDSLACEGLPAHTASERSDAVDDRISE